jgi:hypothetical protein
MVQGYHGLFLPWKDIGLEETLRERSDHAETQ